MCPPARSFIDITPEDSLYGVTFDLVHPPPPASPIVSSNASRASSSNEDCPLHRYLASEERHEQLALTLCSHVQTESTLSTLDTPDGSSLADHSLKAEEPESAGSQSINSANPLHRYLADTLHAHERLAVDLELQGQQMEEKPADQDQYRPKTDSTISLTPSDGAELENSDNIADMTTEELCAMMY
jgi:hypothetical protein